MVQFDGGRQVSGGPPLAGQHNAEVLRSLDYTEDDIEALLRDILYQE